jgi:predicted phosphodiesterase
MAKAPTNADLARALVKRFPDAPSKTLARRLYSENKERFPHLESARDSIRYARGNAGNHARKMASKAEVGARRPNGKSGWSPECPPSQAEAWEVFELPKPCRALVLSDAHFPYHEPKAIETAVEYARKRFKPDVLLLNGDFTDFFSISRWEKDPAKRNLRAELGTCEDGLSWLCGRFPKAERVLKKGNHEERWDSYIWNKAPELWDLPACRLENILHLDKYGFSIVGDHRPIMAGKLPIFHGHELPKGISSPVNPARGAYMRTAHTILIGHLHRPSTHTEPDLWHSETTCWSTGCLCNLRPDYARINKWAWGFAVVDVDASGEFNMHNFKVTQDGTVRTV